MTYNPWTRKQFAFAAAIVSLACVLAALAVGVAYPEPITGGALGPDWQCSRVAFVFTVCSRVAQARPAVTRTRKAMLCLRRA